MYTYIYIHLYIHKYVWCLDYFLKIQKKVKKKSQSVILRMVELRVIKIILYRFFGSTFSVINRLLNATLKILSEKHTFYLMHSTFLDDYSLKHQN